MYPHLSNDSIEEAIERIEKNDNRTCEDRAKRLVELGAYTISLVNRPVAHLMDEFLGEASSSYINGNFRINTFHGEQAIGIINIHIVFVINLIKVVTVI